MSRIIKLRSDDGESKVQAFTSGENIELSILDCISFEGTEICLPRDKAIKLAESIINHYSTKD